MRISDWSSDVCSSDLGLSETDAERLLSAGSRTYNQFTYDDQTDNYQQDHYQALYSHQFSSALNANIGLHLTKGRGYYEELKPGEDFSGYGLEDIITGGDTIRSEEHTSELQSLMRISYAVFCLKKKKAQNNNKH